MKHEERGVGQDPSNMEVFSQSCLVSDHVAFPFADARWLELKKGHSLVTGHQQSTVLYLLHHGCHQPVEWRGVLHAQATSEVMAYAGPEDAASLLEQFLHDGECTHIGGLERQR